MKTLKRGGHDRVSVLWNNEDRLLVPNLNLVWTWTAFLRSSVAKHEGPTPRKCAKVSSTISSGKPQCYWDRIHHVQNCTWGPLCKSHANMAKGEGWRRKNLAALPWIIWKNQAYHRVFYFLFLWGFQGNMTHFRSLPTWSVVIRLLDDSQKYWVISLPCLASGWKRCSLIGGRGALDPSITPIRIHWHTCTILKSSKAHSFVFHLHVKTHLIMS